VNIVGTYLLYLLISAALTIVVGTGLARSGRAFLLDVFNGNDTLARAVSRLLVLGFYLLSLGFVTLTMRSGGDVSGARAGLQLLSVKIGEVLLALGVLPLITLAALARTRRRAQATTALRGRGDGQAPGLAQAPLVSPTLTAEPCASQAGTSQPSPEETSRPQPGRVQVAPARAGVA
jgi:hypothetical protein